MAVSILGSGNAIFGVSQPEVGISVRSVTTVYRPQVDQPILDNVGEVRGQVVSTQFSRDVDIEGEYLSASGVNAWTLLTACIPANNVARYGNGAGTLLLKEITFTETRAEWAMAHFKLHSDPGLIL